MLVRLYIFVHYDMIIYMCLIKNLIISGISGFTLFVGVSFPFFGDLLGFFGGFGFAPTSFFVSLYFLFFDHSYVIRLHEVQCYDDNNLVMNI